MARAKLVYPKISGSASALSGPCIAFEKYDGTNLHWVWNPDIGWHAFGMRRNRYNLDTSGVAEFNAHHKGCGDAVEIFDRDLAAQLADTFKGNPNYDSQNVTVFTEYFGPNSFAGKHRDEDDKRLVLFDVETQQGIIQPDQFIKDFGSLNSARVVYRGKITGKFTNDVREGRYNVNEGVVCKGSTRDGELWMAKIKTNAYMERLKQAFNNNWEAYWE